MISSPGIALYRSVLALRPSRRPTASGQPPPTSGPSIATGLCDVRLFTLQLYVTCELRIHATIQLTSRTSTIHRGHWCLAAGLRTEIGDHKSRHARVEATRCGLSLSRRPPNVCVAVGLQATSPQRRQFGLTQRDNARQV